MNIKEIIEDFKFIETIIKRREALKQKCSWRNEKNYMLVFASTVAALCRNCAFLINYSLRKKKGLTYPLSYVQCTVYMLKELCHGKTIIKYTIYFILSFS